MDKTTGYICLTAAVVLAGTTGYFGYQWYKADKAVKAAMTIIPQTATLPADLADYLGDEKPATT